MEFNDLFKPYSFELKGNLKEYLIEREMGRANNLFFGSEHFFMIRDEGFMRPEQLKLE